MDFSAGQSAEQSTLPSSSILRYTLSGIYSAFLHGNTTQHLDAKLAETCASSSDAKQVENHSH